MSCQYIKEKRALILCLLGPEELGTFGLNGQKRTLPIPYKRLLAGWTGFRGRIGRVFALCQAASMQVTNQERVQLSLDESHRVSL